MQYFGRHLTMNGIRHDVQLKWLSYLWSKRANMTEEQLRETQETIKATTGAWGVQGGACRSRLTGATQCIRKCKKLLFWLILGLFKPYLGPLAAPHTAHWPTKVHMASPGVTPLKAHATQG